jgi:hypothetical protein
MLLNGWTDCNIKGIQINIYTTSVNINGVKWKWKNATHIKFLYIKDGRLLVRYTRNGWSQFVGVLIAK